MSGLLEVQGLSLAGRLADVSLALRPGEVTAICGPNGAGKSSLLLCLAGVLAPDAGHVALDGSALATWSARARARAIGFLAQAGEVAWDMRVDTLVGLGRLPWQASPGHARHAGAHEDAQAVEAALTRMDMQGLRHRVISRLSGGERARALLARVLAGRPGWLLADEPLASLDLAHAQALMADLRAEAAGGTGVVVVAHDLASAMNHADRVLVVHQGRLFADGPPEQALAEPVLAQVWGVRGRWLGEKGRRALSLG